MPLVGWLLVYELRSHKLPQSDKRHIVTSSHATIKCNINRTGSRYIKYNNAVPAR